MRSRTVFFEAPRYSTGANYKTKTSATFYGSQQRDRTIIVGAVKFYGLGFPGPIAGDDSGLSAVSLRVAHVTEQRGAIRILKLAAAQRQLDAAIRMTFADEDGLAVTTVAAAAYRLLRDIKTKRGHRVLADEWRDAIVGTARALARGEIPEDEVNSLRESELWTIVTQLAKQIEVEGAEKPMSALKSLVEIHIPTEAEKKHWNAIERIPNFLKHADRDYEQSLAAEEIDPSRLIFAAINLYLDLSRLTPEMRVWFTYENYLKPNRVPPERFGLERKILEALRTVEMDQRHALAAELIKTMKQRQTRSKVS